MKILEIYFLKFILIETVILTRTFGPDNFCYLKDYENSFCERHQCGQNICSIDEESCKNLERWSNLIDKYVLNRKKIGKLFNFFSLMKQCQLNDQFRLLPLVCSNAVKCDKEKQSFLRFMFGFKPKECFCSGKLNHDCGNDFCSLDMKTCEFLFHNKNKNSSLLKRKIKKCT